MTAEPIRVIVADDHPPVRAGVRTLLDMAGGIEVIAEVGTAEEAISAAADLEPHVLVMDLRMPEIGGVEAIRAVTQQNPGIRVLVLTVTEEREAVFAALKAGARGYLVKESGSDELIRAVHAVAEGGFIASPSVAQRILSFFTAMTRSEPAHEAFPVLTAREREILDLIAQGRNNAYLARHLVLSPKTVRNHISNIFAKLQVADRAAAIVQAREAGLGQKPDGGDHR